MGKSRIVQVTVYPGVAAVERAARLSAGARAFTFDCLPAALDTASLQVRAEPSVRIGEFSVRTTDRDTAGAACASPLNDRIRELEDRLAVAKAESEAAQLVLDYLNGVAKNGVVEDANGRARSANATQIATTSDALRKSALTAREQAHQSQRRQEALTQELKPLLAERERVGGQRTRVVSVTVNLATEREADLNLVYQVRGPGWQPTYRATLDAGRASLLIERLALVAQNSGEDWSNARLTLSTGQPGRATQGRRPGSWTLDVAAPAAPRPVVAMERAMAAAPAPAMAKSVSRADADVEEPMPNFDVGAVDTAFATEFVVPQRITVPSNGQRVVLALGSYAMTAQLFTRVAPAMEEAAYLVAEVAPPPGVWPAGSASLYRDGAYVGQGRIDFSAAGANGLSFGKDERVIVRALPVDGARGTAGLTGTLVERRSVHRYQVENRHENAIQLQVLHAAPVSRNEKIEVVSRYQPTPTETEWNRTRGLVAWQQSLAAGAQAEFSAEHTLRYPKDVELLEQRAP